MWNRQKTGSVICPGCGQLVGVRDRRCLNCGRWHPGMWGFAAAFRLAGRELGFVQIVLGGCVFLYLATLLMDMGGAEVRPGLSALSPSLRALYLFGASGAQPVFRYGRWWTVLSAAWLHGGVIHILFNMLWIRQLGPAVDELYGTSRLVIIYTVSSIVGFSLSSFAGLVFPSVPILGGADYTIGASAPIFGLLAALVFYGRHVGSSHIGSQAWVFAVVLFVFGILMPAVDNWAHLGGFLGGYAASEWLNPERPERGDHAILALACLAATALSIIASVVFGLKQFLGS